MRLLHSEWGNAWYARINKMGNIMAEQNKLQKTSRPLDVLLMAVGALIGFAVFMMPGELFPSKGGPAGTFIGLAISFVLVVPIAYSYGYLLRKYPLCGGSFTFTLIAFRGNKHRKQHAFVSAWFLALAYWALLCLNATGAGLVLRYIFPGVFSGPLLYNVFGWDVYLGEILIALGFIILFGLINLKGMKTASWIQNGVVIVLLGAIIYLVVAVLTQSPDWSNLEPAFPSSKTPFQAIIAMVAMTPWLYMGFDVIPQSAEEYNFTPRKALVLMIVAMAVVFVVYNLMMVIACSYAPWEDMLAMGNFWNLGWAVENYLGRPGLLVMGLAMILGIFSGINAFFTTSSRVLYSMGRVDALPEVFGKLNKNGVPSTAIIFMMVTACIAPFAGRQLISWIVDMFSLGMAVCYTYACISAAIVAKRNNDKLAFFFGSFSAVVAVICVLLEIIPGSPGFLSVEALIALGIWAALGVVFYLINRKNYLASDKIEELAAEASAEVKVEEAQECLDEKVQTPYGEADLGCIDELRAAEAAQAEVVSIKQEKAEECAEKVQTPYGEADLGCVDKVAELEDAKAKLDELNAKVDAAK